MQPDENRYDLFISYADADRAWVEGYLRDALEKTGARCLTEAVFELGVPRLLEFERAVQQSRRILLILSPPYLAENFIQFADLLAQHYGLETATWPVIPLILTPDLKLPLRLALLEPLEASDPADWPRAIERLCAALRRPVPALPPGPPPPYPGMAPFGEDDSARFFGRDREIQDLLERLRLHRFLAVIGPSGSGKSSLVFAGLIPALRKSGLFGSGEWMVKSLRPGETPLATLQTVVGDTLNLQPTDQSPATGDVPPVTGDLPKAVTLRPATYDLRPAKLLLIVDQFEELFTLAGKDAVPFQEALLTLAKFPHCHVVLTARADFYPDLMASPLWPEIQAHRVEVLPLDAEGLKQAIVRPAEDVGVYVEAALVERLIGDAAGEPGMLPFVQETLVLLWERLERRFLPLRAYDALILSLGAYRAAGDVRRTGLQVAMARRADAALADLTPAQQAIARRIFLRLVQFGEGRANTRRQQPVTDLRSEGEKSAELDQVLQHLAGKRLLTLSGEARDAGAKADIAHEALINGWPALKGWIGERREAEQARRRLEAKAAEWVRLGKGRGGLLDEAELAEAEGWLAGPDAQQLGYSETLAELIPTSRTALD
ncbi:MAG: TIR domain-containing protein, partial [Anaerolineae bacterium]